MCSRELWYVIFIRCVSNIVSCLPGVIKEELRRFRHRFRGDRRRWGDFGHMPPGAGFPRSADGELGWARLAPTGGLGEKIEAPPPLGGFRLNPPRGRFPPIRRWWARFHDHPNINRPSITYCCIDFGLPGGAR